MTLRQYQNGFRLAKEKGKVAPQPPKTGRGKVTRFSSASRLRLREWLLMREVPKCVQYGVTLTIPKQQSLDGVLDRFSLAVHRLRTYFLRDCPCGGYVWRVELQRNRMPHLHLVVFLPPLVDSSFFIGLWSRSLAGLFAIPSLDAFLSHGVCIKPLDGNISAYRYICDHAGKRKQAQLGYQGRQWGVVGRGNFIDRISEDIFIPPCLESVFKRVVRRVLSFTVQCPCVFGRKHIRKKGINSVSYMSRKSVEWFVLRSLDQKAICKARQMYYDLPF